MHRILSLDPKSRGSRHGLISFHETQLLALSVACALVKRKGESHEGKARRLTPSPPQAQAVLRHQHPQGPCRRRSRPPIQDKGGEPIGITHPVSQNKIGRLTVWGCHGVSVAPFAKHAAIQSVAVRFSQAPGSPVKVAAANGSGKRASIATGPHGNGTTDSERSIAAT